MKAGPNLRTVRDTDPRYPAIGGRRTEPTTEQPRPLRFGHALTTRFERRMAPGIGTYLAPGNAPLRWILRWAPFHTEGLIAHLDLLRTRDRHSPCPAFGVTLAPSAG